MNIIFLGSSARELAKKTMYTTSEEVGKNSKTGKC